LEVLLSVSRCVLLLPFPSSLRGRNISRPPFTNQFTSVCDREETLSSPSFPLPYLSSHVLQENVLSSLLKDSSSQLTLGVDQKCKRSFQIHGTPETDNETKGNSAAREIPFFIKHFSVSRKGDQGSHCH